MAKEERVLNSRSILELFGANSNIFIECMKLLNEKTKEEGNFDKNFKLWKVIFNKVYGKDVSTELFIKQTYYTHILKLLMISKLPINGDLNSEEFYNCYISTKLSDLNFYKVDYFFWTSLTKNLIKAIYNVIIDTKIEKEDLFRDLYQNIFVSNLRHKTGEYFTPSILVNEMINYTYEFGYKVLDPSCGSGNFLVNIVIRIIESSKSYQNKQKSILKVYGFDINPLAINTTKINISLILLEYFYSELSDLLNLNIFLMDSLFPDDYQNYSGEDFKSLYNSFDLVIGNPPWLTYKDINNKDYQIKIRELSESLNIKPSSQYITHIELAAVFFYAIPIKFLKKRGIIFFVLPKSTLNGDHCYKFRAFSIFNTNVEIWDFPKNYFFNVNHICLKAEYAGKVNKFSIKDRYPIKTKIFNRNIELKEETSYSSFNIEENGAKLILPLQDIELLTTLQNSIYKKKFFQGATLVPRTLVFFKVIEKFDDVIKISTDPDIESRAKTQWKFTFQDREVEQRFQFKTYLNKDLIPFLLKHKKNIFLPVNEQLDFDLNFLQNYPKALFFYKEIDEFYQSHKKQTSSINTLFANLNYWNKLKKQEKNKAFIVVYNASGSNLKSAVINNKNQRIIIGSENYYYSTDSKNEAYYLTAILNAPNLTRHIKLIKSSRHIHKRPFVFPIPLYDKTNEIHKRLARKAIKCQTIVQDLFFKNPSINSEKVRIIINQKLLKIQKLTNQIIFNKV